MIRKYCPKLWHTHKYRQYLNPDCLEGEGEIDIVQDFIRPGSLAIDIGASIGMYSRKFLECGAQVVAFEPQPQMASLLKKCFGNTIEICPIALSDRSGTAQLKIPLDESASGLAAIGEADHLCDQDLIQVDVQTRRLDDYGFRNVSFIKVDVEGHEEQVIAGGIQSIVNNKPCVMIEIEERHNPGSIARVINKMKSLSYDCSFFENGRCNDACEFRPEVHQATELLELSKKIPRRKMSYVNNFLFVPSTRN